MQEALEAPVYTKDNPFPAIITENRLLSGTGSTKETRHFAVSISGSGIRFKPGDSLGVFPTNRPADVDEILKALGASGEEPVHLPRAAQPIALREALFSKLALKSPTRRIVETLAAKASNPAEKAKLSGLLAPESKDLLEKWLYDREFIDLLVEFPSARISPQ
jgi:sulfite reductase (NADPH) flavoprotein alpha-component